MKKRVLIEAKMASLAHRPDPAAGEVGDERPVLPVRPKLSPRYG